MRIDYGTIELIMHPGLSEDQLITMVKTAVEQQIKTNKREHMNEILNLCTHVALFTTWTISPIEVHWKFVDYEYTYKLSSL